MKLINEPQIDKKDDAINKRKICVITFAFTVDNYGQVLQYLATQEYLKARGFESYLLRSKGYRPNVINRIQGALKRRWKQLFTKRLSEMQQQQKIVFDQWFKQSDDTEKMHPRYFEDFRKTHFRMMDAYNDDVARMSFDAYAVGSDQTWATTDESYFLEWAPNDKPLFSIAPSVAHFKFSSREICRLKKLLSRFSFITVREQNGLDLCERANYKGAQLILDPTFLIGKEIYDRFTSSKQTPEEPYILLYLLGNEIAVDVEEIFHYARKKGLKVVYVASQGRDDKYDKTYAQVEEWIDLIKNATYIFTNSFHGMALSIIYRKQFLVFRAVGIFKDMNNRIDQIVYDFQLEDRIYSDLLDTVELPINWDVASQKCVDNKKKLDLLMENCNL